MPIIRDKNGKFLKGNTYWLGKKGIKKANSGSFKKGITPWNKGKRTFKNCEKCGKLFCTRKGKITKPHQRFCSKKCSTWKNGNTPLKKILWESKEARAWRKAVLTKYNYKCVICGSCEDLHCDHIKPKKLYPELMFDVNNGRILCFTCHRKTPTYGNRIK